jgi:signal transduction histidine kinase
VKLRSNLLALTAATLLPMVAFALIASILFARRERATFERGATQRTLALLTAVDGELKSSVNSLAAIATSRHLDADDLPAFQEDARRVLTSQADWFTLDLALPSGQQVVNGLRPFGASLPMIADRESFEQALRTGQPTVGHLVAGPLTNQPQFAVRVPVIRNGVTKYVLSAVIKPGSISQLLAAQKLPPDWVGVVLDGKTRVVARTVAPERTVGELASESLRAALARAPEGWFSGSTIEGARVYTPYNRSAWSGWTVAMGIPAAAVEDAATGMLETMATGLLTAAALAVFVAFLVGRRIAAPIVALASAAERLGRGDPTATRASTRVEEVARLGRAFEEASQLLQRRAAQLAHLQGISDIGLRHDDLDQLLRELLPQLRAALEADTATILLLSEDESHLTPISSDGLREEIEAHVRIPIGRGVSGRIAQSEKGLVVDDLTAVAVFSPYLRDRVKALAGVPLRIGERLIGVLHVGAAGARRFTNGDLDLLRQAGERIARANERAQLVEHERQARAEAETASRSKDEFLAILSHELRTPLNAIFGWARMLQSGRLEGDSAAQALDVIVRNADMQVQLIDDLLDVSRIVAGSMRLDVQPVDLRAVVQAALDAVKPAAAAKEIRLRSVLDPRALGATGDPSRLQQVMWNLLVNAVKFTPKGGRVEVHLQRSNSHVEVVVSDTGQGIRPEMLPHVFERFRQADSTSTRAHAGLGIGLALVRHLVELHGGTVRAESPGEGKGARFTVRLPLSATSIEPTPELQTRINPTARTLPRATPGPSLRGVRVLAVDDDRDSLDLIARVVAGVEGEARTSASAAEGLRVLREWRPDVLVSDIEMPDEDGYTFIRKVRGLDVSQGGKTPAVALTAYGRTQDRLRTLSAGYSMHVPKPVDPVELITIIASLAGR